MPKTNLHKVKKAIVALNRALAELDKGEYVKLTYTRGETGWPIHPNYRMTPALDNKTRISDLVHTVVEKETYIFPVK